MENHDIFQKTFLRTKQAAVYLNLPASTLEKLRSQGGSPKYAKLGRIIVYDVNDLIAWVEAKKRTSTTDTPTDCL
ncbi:MAG: helix-turn-helix domain-containing protein [Alphaproteobacteria bacterium]|nr:helix-turn-helix domain-containing protein [Alphaproteobacteria bacterium]